MPRVVHFEIQADDPERANAFYQKVFGWQAIKWSGGAEDYWLLQTGPDDQPGINGGLLRRKGMVGYVNTVKVESVDDTLRAVQTEGGTVVVPKMAVPHVGWLAYCKDTEDNIFGIMQDDPAAA